jgi:phage terminase small subunit
MPLKNPRHERFAQLLASGKNATDAYELAGYSRDAGNSSHLAKTEEITSRVHELTTEAFQQERRATAIATERAAITKQSLIEMARDTYMAARKDGQNAAAMAAVKEIGVLTGIRIERSERGAPGEFEWLEKLTTDELRLLADGKLDIEAYRQSESRTVN